MRSEKELRDRLARLKVDYESKSKFNKEKIRLVGEIETIEWCLGDK